MTIREAKKQAYSILSNEICKYLTPSPFLDIDCLLMNLLHVERSYLIAHDTDVISDGQYVQFMNMLTKRTQGLPIAYILNEKEFWGLRFYVNESVLIPKSDTEILVQEAILCAKKTFSHNSTFSFLDLCCGSGCIGISVLHTLLQDKVFEHVNCTASDISDKALSIAKINFNSLIYSSNPASMENSLSKTDLIESDLFSAPYFSQKKFDLIVSNPPYVPSTITDELLTDGRSEPRLALNGGKDGLDIIERLIPQAFLHLKPGGCLLLETGEYNAYETAEILQTAGFTDIQHVQDLAGQNRVVISRMEV